MDILNLQPLLNHSSGSPIIKIGLIDGPVETSHIAFNKEHIYEIPGILPGTCSKTETFACTHGTFIAGILKANRGTKAPAICPNCTLLIRSIFSEYTMRNSSIPSTTPKELAVAIISCINAGAQVINLSLALANPGNNNHERELNDALNYAANHGVIIVAAAGNQGTIGSTAIIRHPWVIPVVACKNDGYPMQLSNLGNSIGKYGLRALGEDITSLGCNNDFFTFSGTSAATPFVTGIIALLWSEFPTLSATIIKQAVTMRAGRRSVIPPLVDAMEAFLYLNSTYKQKVVA